MSCIFIDIDEPVFTLWQIFRPIRAREEKKRSILEFVGKRLKKPDLQGLGIRVYETHSGVRLIIEGKALDPKSKESKSLLRSFHADRLYSTLCLKQNCYRARLTRKPHRIKMTDSPFLSLRGEGKKSDRGMDQGIRFQEPRILHVPTGENRGKPFYLALGPIPRREDKSSIKELPLA